MPALLDERLDAVGIAGGAHRAQPVALLGQSSDSQQQPFANGHAQANGVHASGKAHAGASLWEQLPEVGRPHAASSRAMLTGW